MQTKNLIKGIMFFKQFESKEDARNAFRNMVQKRNEWESAIRNREANAYKA